MPLRVIIADDHPAVRVGMRMSVQAKLDEVVACVPGPGQLLAAASAVPCDVILTDLCMPGEREPDGFLMLSELRARLPDTPIVLLTIVDNLGVARVAAAHGIRCIVDKGARAEEIGEAISAAAQGRSFISEALTRRCRNFSLIDANGAWTEYPCDAELELLERLGSGQSLPQAARKMGRSFSYAWHDRLLGMRKLGVTSHAEISSLLALGGLRPAPAKARPSRDAGA
jgi:two-component system capsular synthesis response regulator RcsB